MGARKIIPGTFGFKEFRLDAAWNGEGPTGSFKRVPKSRRGGFYFGSCDGIKGDLVCNINDRYDKYI